MLFRMGFGLLKYFVLRLTTEDMITVGTRIYSAHLGKETISIPISLDLFLPQAAAMDWAGPLLRATIPG